MAEQSLLNQGVPFTASGTGVNLYGGVQRELARADEKKRQDEERAFKLASMIKQADSSQLFGRHYAIANKWASELYKNIGRYTNSTQGTMDFLAQANALRGYIEGKKQYKSANMGDPSDPLNGQSYFSYINRTQTEGNPYAGIDKKEVPKDMEAILKSYNDQTIVSFEIGPDGMPVVDLGTGPMTLVEANQLDVDAPFMADLVEDLDMPLPGEWYEGWAKTRGKITDGSAEAAKRFFEEKVASEDVSLRKLMNWWKGVSGSEKSLDELVAEQGSVARAVDEYGNLVAQKWKDLNEGGEAQAAAQMFSTGEASFDKELKYTAGTPVLDSEIAAELASRGTEGLLQGLGDYNEFRGSVGSTSAEYLGFENLMLLNADEDSDFLITSQEAGDLAEGQLIDAVNVDSMGNIHARLKTAGPVLDDDDMPVYGADMKPLMEVKEEFVVYSPDDPNGKAMFNSIQAHLQKAQPGVDHYARMMRESVDNGAAARRKATKDLILRAEQEAAARRAEAPSDTDEASTPAETPEEADANADATPPPAREEAPPVVEADREALSAISKGLADAGQRSGERRVGVLGSEDMTAYKMPDGMPRSTHFDAASESLLSQNYSHREIVDAFNDPRFSEALIESGYDSDRDLATRGAGGAFKDFIGGLSIPTPGGRGSLLPGLKSEYTQQVDKVEAALKSIMDDRATTQAAPEPISPEPMDPVVTDEAPTERDFSGLPEISNVSASASRGVALSEGYSSQNSINVPGGNSGVTVGGIDLGSVAGNEDIKLKILKPFVSQEDYKALEGLAGLIGDEASAGLKAAQDKGLLNPETLISSDADLQSIVSYGIESFVLPSIYKHIPKEEFDALPEAVTDVLINVQFMTPGEDVLKAAVKANKKDKKNAWLKVADLYYKPVVERDSMEQEKDDLLKYTANDDLLSVDAPYKSTYYGDASRTDMKLDNYKKKKEGKKILPGNVKRVLEARWQLLDWINTKYGNE